MLGGTIVSQMMLCILQLEFFSSFDSTYAELAKTEGREL